MGVESLQLWVGRQQILCIHVVYHFCGELCGYFRFPRSYVSILQVAHAHLWETFGWVDGADSSVCFGEYFCIVWHVYRSVFVCVYFVTAHITQTWHTYSLCTAVWRTDLVLRGLWFAVNGQVHHWHAASLHASDWASVWVFASNTPSDQVLKAMSM